MYVYSSGVLVSPSMVIHLYSAQRYARRTIGVNGQQVRGREPKSEGFSKDEGCIANLA